MRINLTSPICSTGYGLASFNLMKALHNAGNDVSLFPINEKIESQFDCPEIQASLKSAQAFDATVPSIRIWHQDSMAHFVGKGPHIGFPIFELDTFTDLEKHHLSSCDYLFVCSEWAKSICIKNGLDGNRIFVVPLGVDASIFKPSPVLRNNTTIFTCIGKWEHRKSHDLIIKAFREAFSYEEDVLLIMCCTNPFLTPQEEANWLNIYNHPKVRITPRLPTQREVASLINCSDCMVLPSRAEGWNLEALETLACGRKLITTNYSAHTEFCTPENSMLVEPEGLESASDGKWFFNQGNWAKLGPKSVTKIAEYMRSVHLEKFNKTLTLNEAGVETAKKFTWDNAANILTSNIDYITQIEYEKTTNKVCNLYTRLSQ